MEAKLEYVDTQGIVQGVKIDHTIYEKAAVRGMSVRHYINILVEDDAHEKKVTVDGRKGDGFLQAVQLSNLMPRMELGENSYTMKQLMAADLNSSATRAGGGADTLGSGNAAARILYPQMVLEAISASINDNVRGEDLVAKLSQMVAINRNVTTSRIDQPVINVRGAENVESQTVSQLALPPEMIEITISDKTYRIPQYTVGMQVADQALEAVNLDLVTLLMSRQARGQRVRMIKKQMGSIIKGDPDMDLKPLPVDLVTKFDPSITENGKITKLAYLEWLREKREERTLTRGLTTLRTALSIDDQFTSTNVLGPDSHRMQVPFNGIEMDIPFPTWIDLDAETLGGSNRLVAMDPSYGIQRFVNLSAEFQAVEEYILRRGKGFRVDHGEMWTRLYDEAFAIMDLRIQA